MIKIHTLLTKIMNGTVTMQTYTDSFISRELAQKTKIAVEEANKDCGFNVLCEIKESVVYENESEVKILNNK